MFNGKRKILRWKDFLSSGITLHLGDFLSVTAKATDIAIALVGSSSLSAFSFKGYLKSGS